MEWIVDSIWFTICYCSFSWWYSYTETFEWYEDLRDWFNNRLCDLERYITRLSQPRYHYYPDPTTRAYLAKAFALARENSQAKALLAEQTKELAMLEQASRKIEDEIRDMEQELRRLAQD